MGLDDKQDVIKAEHEGGGGESSLMQLKSKTLITPTLKTCLCLNLNSLHYLQTQVW